MLCTDKHVPKCCVAEQYGPNKPPLLVCATLNMAQYAVQLLVLLPVFKTCRKCVQV